MNPSSRFWIDQMKSGRHRQCRHRLWQYQNGHDAYDPLGLACMLYSRLGNPLLMDDSTSSFFCVETGREYVMHPPMAVLDWLGIDMTGQVRWMQPYMLLCRSSITGVSLFDYGVFLETEPAGMFV